MTLKQLLPKLTAILSSLNILGKKPGPEKQEDSEKENSEPFNPPEEPQDMPSLNSSKGKRMAFRAEYGPIINSVASQLGVNANDLTLLIRFETAGTFDPQIKNPYSSARGLLQFTDAAAQDLGFSTSQKLVQAYPTFESQMLGAVLPWLRRYGPYRDTQDLYMQVFYPAYRKVPAETQLASSIQKVNPGIRTVQDYIDKVRGSFVHSEEPAIAGTPMGAVIIAGALGYLWLKHKKG